MLKLDPMSGTNLEDSTTNITRFMADSSKYGDESPEAVVNLRKLHDTNQDEASDEQASQQSSQISDYKDM